MTSSSTRKHIALYHQGQLLVLACNQQSVPAAIDQAHGMIDGAFNALLQLEDQAKVAEFAFAMADRVSAGVKGVTAWPPSQKPHDADQEKSS